MHAFTYYTHLLKGVIFLLFLLSFSIHAAERITYYHTDALGSPVAATDQQGNVVWRETYEPYGARIKKEPAASTNARWHTGHALDVETGLQYAGARYYDPVLGRFMGIDPKGFSQGNPHSFNRYNYGSNNPYKYIDPDGAWSTDAHNYFIDQAFSGLSSTVRGYIKEGSSSADALPNQIMPGRESIHSMWGTGGSSETMQRERAEYISERLGASADLMGRSTTYREAGATGLADNFERRAWIEYGKALHPIMDSTSPVHNQEWRIGDRHAHGDYANSKENMSAAPAYRNETVRRMQDIPSFLSR